jgi:intracellular multiplication protein IcmJ
MSNFGLPIELRASIGAWRLYSARKIDPKFEAFKQKVLKRDRYRCQYCGFQATDFQDVVNVDGDFANNKLTNLVTACPFCAQCFFVESVGVGGYGGGTLIYLPDMSQPVLNSICHVLFCAITNNTGYKNTAQTLYRSFKFRSVAVEEKYGEGTSDPSILGQLIIDSGVSNSDVRQIFSELRLLPSRAKFRVQIERWAANALKGTS